MSAVHARILRDPYSGEAFIGYVGSPTLQQIFPGIKVANPATNALINWLWWQRFKDLRIKVYPALGTLKALVYTDEQVVQQHCRALAIVGRAFVEVCPLNSGVLVAERPVNGYWSPLYSDQELGYDLYLMEWTNPDLFMMLARALVGIPRALPPQPEDLICRSPIGLTQRPLHSPNLPTIYGQFDPSP